MLNADSAQQAPQSVRRGGGGGGRRMVGEVADLEDDLSLLREPLEQIAERSQQLSEICEYEKRQRTFGLRAVNDNADSIFEAKLTGLQERAEYRVTQAGNYKRFFLTFIFFATYSAVLFMQRDIGVSYEIETSILMNLIAELPRTGMGGYMNEGRSAKGLVKDIDEFYSWFDKTIIKPVFQDAVCGDGRCDAPEEFPGFGRFGCERDCGRYDKITSLTVDLRPLLTSSPENWDISKIKFANEPNFKYNIYSDTLNDFLWEEDQDGIQNPINVIDVPDGRLTLHLYQGSKLWTPQSVTSAPGDLRMSAAGFPAVNGSASAFEYGDPAEVLMFARTVVRGLEDACWESAKSISMAPEGCDKFDWWDWYARALSGYGIAGRVSVNAGRKSAGNEVLVDVPFCGVIPGGDRGVDDAKIRQQLISAREPCASAAAPSSPLPITKGMGPQTTSTREGICISHHNCSAGLFCSRWPHQTGGPSAEVRRAGGAAASVGVCQPCNLCRVDSEDAWNASGVDLGVCPQDRCPGSGGLPACVSAQKLLSSFSCVSSHNFEVWKHHPKNSKVSVKPENVKERPARFVTLNNRLVGAVVLTQERVSRSNCVSQEHVPAEGIAASFGWHRINPSLSNYTRAAGNKLQCRPNDLKLNSQPTGSDPVFMLYSKLYDGKALPQDYYDWNERSSTSGLRVPFLFFPHGYDQVTRAPKQEKFVSKQQAEYFKVYFDDRLTQTQAQRMLEALKDGSFYDPGATKKMTIEMVTYNAESQVFVKLIIMFEFQPTGFAQWDFDMQSYAVDLYSDNVSRFFDSTIRLLMEMACIGMLMVNMSSEFLEIWQEALIFRLKHYLTNLFNYIDWASFIFQISAWATWFTYVLASQRFSIEESYDVLHDPSARARFFATSAEEEHKYLTLLTSLSNLGQLVKVYSTMSGLAVGFFIFRLLKSLDFQPRMGLVTRTIAAAAVDLLHFLMLFSIVFLGYAIVGTIIFGHQFDGMRNLAQSGSTLLIVMLSFDPTKFWTEMEHAAGTGMATVFYLYLTTYIVIVFFILLNIFLAILIDAYSAVKSHTTNTKSMGKELYEVTRHAFKKYFMPKHKFICNERLVAALRDTRNQFLSKDRTGSSLETQAKEVLGARQVVLLHSGLELDNEDLVRLLGHHIPGAQSEFYDEEDEAMYYAMKARDDMVVDLLARYGENVQHRREEQNADILELLKLENLKRELAVYRAQTSMLAQQNYILKAVELISKNTCDPEQLKTLGDVLNTADKVRLHTEDPEPGEVRKLTVEIAQAKNLPRMDLLGRCDTYCVLIISGENKHSVYSTTVIPKNTNPEWNETFSWMISSNSDRVLTITLMDKDTFKSDDLIGCVYINLHDLPLDKEVNQWWPIENPASARSLSESKIRLCLSLRTLSHRPGGAGNVNGGVAAGRRKRHRLLPSRAPSSPRARDPKEGSEGEEEALQAGWGPRQGRGFFPGSSGIGWGVGGAYGNKIVPSAEPASLLEPGGQAAGSRSGQDQQPVDALLGQIEALTGALPQRPQQDPPPKMFKRAPSSMSARRG